MYEKYILAYIYVGLFIGYYIDCLGGRVWLNCCVLFYGVVGRFEIDLGRYCRLWDYEYCGDLL